MNSESYFSLGVLFVFGSFLSIGEPIQNPIVSDSGDSFALVQATLEKAGGSLTPEVRSAYLDWAERTVLASLSREQKSISPECLAEVRADPDLRDAMFAAIAPPDPSIIQNYDNLRSQLGPEFMAKYRSLVIAAAVANRRNGAKSEPDNNSEIVHIRAPVPETPKEVERDRFIGAIASFMKLRQGTWSVLDLYQKQAAQQDLESYLKAEGFDSHLIAQVDNSGSLFDLLKRAMVKLGERPAHRSAPPDMVPWLRYVASVFETTTISSSKLGNGQSAPWPRFPIDKAPWPLLMPLYHAYPLDEARYILETYEGEHGTDRYHTYGPYETGEPERVRELRPSPWNWAAWPDIIVHGGDCTVMAPMAVETHVALGEPAYMAGQPGHSNLMSNRCAKGFWYVAIEQAFAGGPDVTWGAWLFNEIGTAPGLDEQNNRPWATSEYQMGLALAMNVGLKQYVDTRIAVNFFHLLPETEKTTLGTTLLSQAVQTNEYNPAPWHLLAKQSTNVTTSVALVQRILDAAKAENTAMKLANANAAGNSSQGPISQPYPESAIGSTHDYWGVLAKWVTKETILKHPVPADKAQAGQIYNLLPSIPGISDNERRRYGISDVTAIIKSAVTGDSLAYFVTSSTLGDPAHDASKKLKVEYTLDGIADTKIVPEGGTLTLSATKGQSLVITHATYGDIPEKYFDVTDVLNGAISENALNIPVNNNFYHVDPSGGVQKRLKVEYTLGGVLGTKIVPEGTRLKLGDADGQELIVTNAIYGDIPEKYIDVTDILNAAIKTNGLSIPVSVHTFHGDPAMGAAKKLRVGFTLNGVPDTKIVPEGARLIIDASNGQKLVITKATYGIF